MHSSNLRGTDFQITDNGRAVSHTNFFSGLSTLDRVGVVSPNGTDGVGAVNLIMAYVTGFYDKYRAAGNDFFAYPNYYTFQSSRSLASYTMLDIWPKHKDVRVENNSVDLLNAINDRAINILLLPDGEPSNPSLERPQIESALRRLKTCYLYSAEGEIKNPDLIIQSNSQPMVEWAQTLFDTHDYQPNPDFADQKAKWVAKHGDKQSLLQNYRRMTAEEALTRL